MVTALNTLTKTISICAVCGKKGTETNTLNLPSCKDHLALPTNIPICPNCDTKMILKTGKRGTFWSCPDYPACFGTRNLQDPDAVPDVL